MREVGQSEIRLEVFWCYAAAGLFSMVPSNAIGKVYIYQKKRMNMQKVKRRQT